MSTMRISILMMTMKEISQIPPNHFNVVSTFSGAGGSCLGFKMCGYNVLWANEFVEAARDVYKINHPETPIDHRDIRDITGDDIRKHTKNQTIHVLEGSPPCSSFSTAGIGKKGWGKAKSYSEKIQVTDDLFYEFIRLVDELSPLVFVAENVTGLIKGDAKGYFKNILGKMKAQGYNVKCAKVNAAYLGVPQSRERMIFIGVRNDLNVNPAFPAPRSKVITVKEVLPHVIRFRIGGAPDKWRTADYPYSTVVQRGHALNKGAYLSANGYIEVENESPAVRKWTIDELKIICGFPDDFILTGNFGQQWERLGRAVPPPMMKAIAETIQNEVLL